jgi:hypothetical protein
MLQKAYVAGGFTGTGGPQPANPSYEDIASGFAHHAMEVLTGQRAERFVMQGGGPSEAGGLYFSTGASGTNRDVVPWDVIEVQRYDLLQSFGANADYKSLKSFEILKDKAKVDTWMTFVKTDEIRKLFAERTRERAAGRAGDITLADIETVFAKGPDRAVTDPILAWVAAEKLYPGSLGTAKYSKSQLEHFGRIKDVLDRGGSVTGTTLTKPGATNSAGPSGESMSQGIAGGHAYSILGYRASVGPDPGDLAATGDFVFLKIRNPWGNYGRGYTFANGTGAGQEIQGGNGVSWLELSDLTRFFGTIDIQ